MATTTPNFGWDVPQSTDLVKDGATAIAALGNDIDTSLVDLKGGTTGQVLTKATNTDLDFTWGSAATAASYSLLNAGGTSLTGAQTVTVSGISGRGSIYVILRGASSASVASTIGIRFNTDTGTNYNYAGWQFRPTANSWNNNYWNTLDISSDTYFPIGRMPDSSATATVSGGIMIEGCNSAGLKMVNATGTGNNADVGFRKFGYFGFYNSSSTISSVSAFSETGNFDAGTMFVYASNV